jgi:S1-C subfamily serine protease
MSATAAKRSPSDTTYHWKDNMDAIGRMITIDSGRFVGAGFYVAPYGVVVSASHVSAAKWIVFEHIHSFVRDTLVVSIRLPEHDLVVYEPRIRSEGSTGFQFGTAPGSSDSVMYLGLREDGVLYRFDSRISAIGNYVLPGDSLPVTAMAIDANVMSGMSGGPVLDTAGYVIGVIVGRLTHTPQGGSDSTAVLAMPTDSLRHVLEEATDSGDSRK